MENKRTRVINLSTSEENHYNTGEYASYGNRWVNFGKNNNYTDYLLELYMSSPTHQAIIDGIVNLTLGEGVEIPNPEQNPISNKFLNENFPDSVVKNLISDLKIYGYCAVQIYNGEIVKYTEARKYRLDSKDENGVINYCWYSNNWDEYQHKSNRPEKLPLYTEGSDEELSVLIVTLDKKGYDYYAPVDYCGAIDYISLECEIGKYHLNNIHNGLFPSFLINYIGEFTDEQMDLMESGIAKKFGGSSNTGKAIISYSPNSETQTTLTTIDQPQISEQYQFLSTECASKVMIGHGVTSPLLFGIRDSGGGFGNNADELEKAYYMMWESKLKHYQNYIIDLISIVMRGNLLFAKPIFKTYNPFNVTEKTQTLSKIEDEMTETNTQDIIFNIDLNAVKVDGKKLNERLFNGVLNENAFYKFVKSSNRSDMVIKKLEMMDKKGFLFKASPLIKNCKDYYFMEVLYIQNNN